MHFQKEIIPQNIGNLYNPIWTVSINCAVITSFAWSLESYVKIEILCVCNLATVCVRACVHASCYIPCLYVENRGGELENKEYWADWHHVATRWSVPLSSSHFISIWENRRTQRAWRTGNTIITSRHTSKNTGGYWRTGSTIRVIACYCIDSIIMV